MVNNYKPLESACTNDEKDRHVLAAAVRSSSNAIITFNLKHFGPEHLAPFDVVARHPADYLVTLYDMEPGLVTNRVYEIADAQGMSIGDYLAKIPQSLRAFADHFTDQTGLGPPAL